MSDTGEQSCIRKGPVAAAAVMEALPLTPERRAAQAARVRAAGYRAARSQLANAPPGPVLQQVPGPKP